MIVLVAYGTAGASGDNAAQIVQVPNYIRIKKTQDNTSTQAIESPSDGMVEVEGCSPPVERSCFFTQ